MKKVARLRIAQEEANAAGGNEQAVRTTGRVKKPKAVYDPSDNYLPRAQRPSIIPIAAPSVTGERKKELMHPELQQVHSKRLSQSSTTSMGTTNTTLSDISDVCVVCQKREAKRGAYAKNKLITCLECEKKAHRMCLKVEFEDLDMLRQNYKCDTCRTCDLCDAFADGDAKINKELLTCAKCVKSYHPNCHIPNVHKFQQIPKNWKCNKCSLPTMSNGGMMPLNIREIIGGEPPKSAKPQAQPAQAQSVNIAAAAAEAKSAAVKRTLEEGKSSLERHSNGSNGVEHDCAVSSQKKSKRASTEDAASVSNTVMRYSPNEPLDLPDVKDWSVDQVAEFFAKYFPKEAHVFREHEIDGCSLLLLKRSDIIKKLPIKLGPSLRIYSLILKIQTQMNDPTLGWNCGL